MSEIAVQAGVGRATLHRHFRTREDLVSAIGIRCIEEMNVAVRSEQAVSKGAVDRLRSALRAVIPLGDRYSFLGSIVSNDSMLLESYEGATGLGRDFGKRLKGTRRNFQGRTFPLGRCTDRSARMVGVERDGKWLSHDRRSDGTGYALTIGRTSLGFGSGNPCYDRYLVIVLSYEP